MVSLLALVLGARDVGGQLRFGAGGGPVTPIGGFSDPLSRGSHGELLLDLGVPWIPLALRASIMYARLPAADPNSEDYSHLAGTLNARIGVLPIPLLDAYVTAGMGLYSSDYAGVRSGAGGRLTERGINAGVGASADLSFIRPFAEVRYHRVASDPVRSFVPLTVGVIVF